MKIIWYGTASIAFESNKKRILFDPFVPLRGSKVATKLTDYIGYKEIFVTHGHFDHISDIPNLIERSSSAYIYCTKTPADTLMKSGVPRHNIRLVRPGESFTAAGFYLRLWQGRHADLEVASDVVFSPRIFRYAANLPVALSRHLSYQENGETLVYEILADGKRVLLLGSMNLADGIDYPDSCDVLILPYVGYKDNLARAEQIISRLGPKKVILDHWDDTFPPLTDTVDTSAIESRYTDIEIIKPEHKKPIEI